MEDFGNYSTGMLKVYKAVLILSVARSGFGYLINKASIDVNWLCKAVIYFIYFP